MTTTDGLTVAVTGPTGDIGRPFIKALETAPGIGEIRAMARRPFDPRDHGWQRTTYRRGDVLDRAAIDEFVAGADIVVHLAFLIMGGREETAEINLRGSRNVFEATVASGAERLIYTSSVAAYGFHPENPSPLTEDVPPRGTDEHYYSAQKAELEGVLDEIVGPSATKAWVYRPCIVAGPESLALVEALPYVKVADRLPGAVRRLLELMPILKPVLPDPGVPLQLVHADDVASALVAGVLGKGEPGVYNLGADGTILISELADELGWYSVPIPDLAIDATAEVVNRLPFLPAETSWINTVRAPTVMDSAKARKELAWSPQYDTRETLRQTVEAARVTLFPDW